MKYIAILVMVLSLAVCGPPTPNTPPNSSSQIAAAQTLYLPTIIQKYPVVAPTLTLTVPTDTQQTTETPYQTNTPQPSVSPPASITPSFTPSASPIPGQYTFTDGYGGEVNTAKDNLLNSAGPTLNLGEHNNFEVSPTQNAILQFDLSSIPSSAICVNATLYVYKSYPIGEGGGNPTATVYSIAKANAGWLEGTGSLELALEDESCWNAKAADGVAGVKAPWAGSAGCNTSGIDYEAEAIGSLTWTPRDDEIGTEYAIALDPNRIQGWFGTANTNYGIIIKTVNGGDHWGQSDNPTIAYRPKLVLEYIIP